MRWRESSEPAKITRILVLGMVSLEVQNFALSAVPCVELRSFRSFGCAASEMDTEQLSN